MMSTKLQKKLHSRSGALSRLAVILIVAVIVMLAVVSVPAYHWLKTRSDRVGCSTALKSAMRELTDAYILRGGMTADEAKAEVTRAMQGWENLCPAGGTVYLIETDEDMPYDLVCGLHGPDAKQRTRLNSYRVWENLVSELQKDSLAGAAPRESVPISINGNTLEVKLLDEPNDLRRGTKASNGFEGVVAFYTYSQDTGMTWFVYADEDHAAVWRRVSGWSGDSWD